MGNWQGRASQLPSYKITIYKDQAVGSDFLCHNKKVVVITRISKRTGKRVVDALVEALSRLTAVGEAQPGKEKAVVLDAPAYPAVAPSGGNSLTKVLVSMPFEPPSTEAVREPLLAFTWT